MTSDADVTLSAALTSYVLSRDRQNIVRTRRTFCGSQAAVCDLCHGSLYNASATGEETQTERREESAAGTVTYTK